MVQKENDLSFTGEYFIPGKSGERIEADHIERYRFACKYAKGKSVLDIACGVGYSSHMFIEAGAVSYDGVDINEKLIQYAKIIIVQSVLIISLVTSAHLPKIKHMI